MIIYAQWDTIPRNGDVLDWVDENFLRPDPFAFSEEFWRKFTLKCSRLLGVEANGVYCIGSGALGYSLSPGKMRGSEPKLFDEESDIDLAIISHRYFEDSWRHLRSISHPAQEALDKEFRENIKWQKKRLFDGAILVNHFVEYLPYGEVWLRGMSQLAQMVSVELGREVEIGLWIYRDYWSVRNYVAEGAVAVARLEGSSNE